MKLVNSLVGALIVFGLLLVHAGVYWLWSRRSPKVRRPVLIAGQTTLVICVVVASVDFIRSFVRDVPSIITSVFTRTVFPSRLFQRIISKLLPDLSRFSQDEALIIVERVIPAFVWAVTITLAAMVVHALITVAMVGLGRIGSGASDSETRGTSEIDSTGFQMVKWTAFVAIALVVLWAVQLVRYGVQIGWLTNTPPRRVSWAQVNSQLLTILLSIRGLGVAVPALLPIPCLLFLIDLLVVPATSHRVVKDDSEQATSTIVDETIAWKFMGYLAERYGEAFRVLKAARIAKRDEAVSVSPGWAKTVDVEEREFLERILKATGTASLFRFQARYLEAFLSQRDCVITEGFNSGKRTIAHIATVHSILFRNGSVLYLCADEARCHQVADAFHRMFSDFVWFEGVRSSVVAERGQFNDEVFAYSGVIFTTPEVLHVILASTDEAGVSFLIENLQVAFIWELDRFTPRDLHHVPFLIRRLDSSRKAILGRHEAYSRKALSHRLLFHIITVPFANARGYLENRLLIDPGDAVYLAPDTLGPRNSNHRYAILRLYELPDPKGGELAAAPLHIAMQAILHEVQPILFYGFEELLTGENISEALESMEQKMLQFSDSGAPDVRSQILLFSNARGDRRLSRVRLVIASGSIEASYRTLHDLGHIGFDNDLLFVVFVCKDPSEEFYLEFYSRFWGLREAQLEDLPLRNPMTRAMPNRMILDTSRPSLKPVIQQHLTAAAGEADHTVATLTGTLGIDSSAAVSGLESGEASFESLDPSNPESPVRIRREVSCLDAAGDRLAWVLDQSGYELILDSRSIGVVSSVFVRTRLEPFVSTEISRVLSVFYLAERRVKIDRIDHERLRVYLEHPPALDLTKSIPLRSVTLDNPAPDRAGLVGFASDGGTVRLQNGMVRISGRYRFLGAVQFDFVDFSLNRMLLSDDSELCVPFATRAFVIRLDAGTLERLDFWRPVLFELLAGLIRIASNMALREPFSEIDAVHVADSDGGHSVYVFDIAGGEAPSDEVLASYILGGSNNVIILAVIDFLEFMERLDDTSLETALSNLEKYALHIDRSDSSEPYTAADLRDLGRLLDEIDIDRPEMEPYEWLTEEEISHYASREAVEFDETERAGLWGKLQQLWVSLWERIVKKRGSLPCRVCGQRRSDFFRTRRGPICMECLVESRLCAHCGKEIATHESYVESRTFAVFGDGHDSRERLIRCHSTCVEGAEVVCDYCGLPSLNDTRLKDGLHICYNCNRLSVRSKSDARSVFHTVIDILSSHYGIEVGAVSEVQFDLCDAVEMARRTGIEFTVGDDTMDIRVLGVFVTNYHMAILHHLPFWHFAGTIAHECVHWWQQEQGLLARLKSTEPDLVEGMATWIEVQVFRDLGFHLTAESLVERTAHPTDEYERGLKIMLELEKRHGAYGLFELIRNSEDIRRLRLDESPKAGT